jgi:hypothetical protein
LITIKVSAGDQYHMGIERTRDVNATVTLIHIKP